MTGNRTPPPRGFFRAILCDENNVPDEANLAFLGALIELAVGAFIPRFPLTAFAASVCAIIPLYRLSRGDLRASLPAVGAGTGDSQAGTPPP